MSVPTEHSPAHEEQAEADERSACGPGPIKRLDRPDQEREPNLVQRREAEFGIGREAQGVEHGLANSDKEIRSGTVAEPVRNTPPAGDWNETAPD